MTHGAVHVKGFGGFLREASGQNLPSSPATQIIRYLKCTAIVIYLIAVFVSAFIVPFFRDPIVQAVHDWFQTP